MMKGNGTRTASGLPNDGANSDQLLLSLPLTSTEKCDCKIGYDMLRRSICASQLTEEAFFGICGVIIALLVLVLVIVIWTMFHYIKRQSHACGYGWKQRNTEIVELQPYDITTRRAGLKNGGVENKYASSTETGNEIQTIRVQRPLHRSQSARSSIGENEVGTADTLALTSNMEQGGTALNRSVSCPVSTSNLGKLKYFVEYDGHHSSLLVGIKEAANLPAMDHGGCDPYVKVYLLPDGKPKFETKVHMRSLNPIFDESFRFTLMEQQIEEKVLVMMVYDFNRFSKDEPVGEIKHKLTESSTKEVFDGWKDIQPLNSASDLIIAPSEQRGALFFSLNYIPPVGRLIIEIIEARDLKKMDITGLSDPFVKIVLMHDGKLLKKAKTTIKKRTLNPTYKETFVFDLVPFEQIQGLTLVLLVLDHDRIGSADRIGKVVLGSETSGPSLEHWTKMLESPRQAVEQWHTLQPCW